MRPGQLVIRSGGQTGVDRAALDCAIARSLPYAGWCPRGGGAEDLPDPPGVLAIYPHLVETPSSVPEQRTAWNVRDSHATLIILGAAGVDASPGTKLAVTCAQAIFQRPFHVADTALPGAERDAKEWLARIFESIEPFEMDPIVLNVAGPRESECPGVYLKARRFIAELLEICR